MKVPPKYNTGVYNNRYISLFENEMTIYNEKIKRPDPLVTASIAKVKEAKKNNSKLKARLKKTIKKKYQDITNIEFLEHVFEETEKSPETPIDLDFFSQYIPQLGFRFCIDLMFN